jgi:hypothetical protein
MARIDSVMRSSNAVHSRGLGTTRILSENGRLVLTMTPASSARSAMTWNGTPHRFGRRHVAHFIERYRIVAGPASRCSAELQADALPRPVHLITAAAAANRTRRFCWQAATASPVRASFTGAAVAYKNDGLRFRDVIAFSQFVNLLGRDLGIAGEVELLQGLHARQTGFANASLDQPLFAFLEFGL